MNKADELLADIRELTVELHDGELTEKDEKRLEMLRDVLRQIRADGVPDHPIISYVQETGWDVARYGHDL